MAVPFSDLQEINPGAVIELFRLDLFTSIHDNTALSDPCSPPSGVSTTYLFHAGSNLNANGAVVWNGETYLRFPVEAEGFDYSGTGQLPRPTMRIANLNGTITALLATLPNGLERARVTRIRTLIRYLDAANFPGNTNPYGTPDPTAEFPQEIYYVDRKSAETRDVVEFELAAAFDLAGVKAPKRQCISNLCQWTYKCDGCGYTPKSSVAGTYNRKYLSSATYSQSGTTITVTSSSHGISAGEIVYLTRTNTFSGTYAQDAPVNLGQRNVTYATYDLVITASGHGLSAGEEVSLDFTSGANAPPKANYTVVSATTNTFTVSNRFIAPTAVSGNVSGSLIRPDNYFVVASAATNTFTVTDNKSRSETGSATVNWLKVNLTAHGLSAGDQAYFIYDQEPMVSGLYQPSTVATNSMTFKVNDNETASGSVTMTQWFDRDNNPVTTESFDICGKTLDACQHRFSNQDGQPFGGFPGIGAFNA